jgi:glutamyl-tRNA synthetase
VSVRVRYAPSPTGFQHIGSVRTALYNYLFARSQGGEFILRIEDTDRERYVEEALQDIYETFEWLGFHWDEGPDVGGPKGPYFQSERVAIYRKYADELIAKGMAYPCFCSPERMDALRKEQAGGKSGMGYDRHCRDLSDAARREAQAAGAVPVTRLKIPLAGSTTFTDALLGDVTVENKDINPDPVLIKSDGFPTYHMANVVDDHLMEITDIMRAQEWLPSAPLHKILYEAFGWAQPRLCHLPMVMGSDGHKLSKRHGATNIRELRKLGYLPEALINCIALVGWSYDDAREFFTLGELESLFSMEKINKAPAVFDYQKLDWFNGSYIRKLSAPAFARAVKPLMQAAGYLKGDSSEESLLASLAPLVQERVKLLTEVPAMVRYLFDEPAPPAPEDLLGKKQDPARALAALRKLEPLLPELSQPGDQHEARLRAVAEELGMKLGDMLMPLRVAVTGARVSPPLFDSIRLMGAERARARTARAIAVLTEYATRSS